MAQRLSCTNVESPWLPSTRVGSQGAWAERDVAVGATGAIDGCDQRDESVPTLGHGLDVLFAVSGLPERAAKGEHVIGEVALLDERVGPDILEEFVLGDQAAGPGSQRR